jgi:tripartite-type tricarboxylate transporter receptor subunit TctC
MWLISLQHVPYRGSAPAALDLVGKRLDFMMDPAAALIEFVGGGRLRALAVSRKPLSHAASSRPGPHWPPLQDWPRKIGLSDFRRA